MQILSYFYSCSFLADFFKRDLVIGECYLGFFFPFFLPPPFPPTPSLPRAPKMPDFSTCMESFACDAASLEDVVQIFVAFKLVF